MGTPIWPCCKKFKGSLTVIIWTNLADRESLILYTKIQPQNFLGSGEEDFKCMGMAAISFDGMEPFEQIGNILLTKGPMWNLVKITQAV